jgi:hypothetical protein
MQFLNVAVTGTYSYHWALTWLNNSLIVYDKVAIRTCNIKHLLTQKRYLNFYEFFFSK